LTGRTSQSSLRANFLEYRVISPSDQRECLNCQVHKNAHLLLNFIVQD
jgi:hypothetical protein